MRVLALLILILTPAALVAATPPDGRPLPSQGVEVELAGGESHTWSIVLAVDDFLSVVVDQRGIDVAVEALAPDGESLVTVDSPNGRDGPEPLTVIATTPGEYRVIVRSPSAEAPPGRYEIRATEPRPASAEDRQRHAAERAQIAAHRAGDGRDAASYRESVRRYREVVAAWRALDDREREAETLLRLGTRLQRLGEAQEAADVLRQALAIFDELDDRPAVAETWNRLALAAWLANDEEAALAACRTALELWDALGDSTHVAATLNTLGLISFRTGRLPDALAAYQRALEIFRRLADRRGEAITLHNIGGVLDLQGDPAGALEHYRQALAVARERGDHSFEAEILHNQGSLYFRLGEAQEALQHYSLALPIFERLGDRRRQAAVLGSLGLLHLSLRDFDRALTELGAALELEKAIENRHAQAWTLFSLGAVYRQLEQPERALAVYDKSLELLADFDDPRGRAAVLTELGAALAEAGQHRKALAPLTEARQLQADLGTPLGQTLTLLERGRVHTLLAEPQAAADDFARALVLSREAGSQRREAEALYALAGVERDRGSWQRAWEYAAQALELAESLRARVAGNDLRASYFTSLREIFELAIDLLMERSRREGEPVLAKRALEIAERARARALLDQLREARLDLRQGVDRELLAREERLRLELDDRVERQRRLRQAADTLEQAAALEPEIELKLRQLADVEAEIRAASPRYALLTQPVKWSLLSLQEDELDDETVLLEYFLGERRSFLWVVTRESVEVHELPPRAAIEDLVRKVYQDLSTADPRRSLEERRNQAELAGILLAPVASRLAGDLQGKRLAVVADGALQYVPFAALPLAGQPLMVGHELVNLPSAMVLGELRQRFQNRPRAPGALALFADPVFSADDPRITLSRPEPGSAPSTEPTAMLGSSTARGKLSPAVSYKRLPWTHREAGAILEAVAVEVAAEQRFLALGLASNVETVKNASLSDYRILHFATHGEIDSARPQLSALVLSLVDENGLPQDGFLRLHDIYALDLRAELVVLSGCGTALGKEILGEGLQSLTRGFFHAGTPRVVASLWSVQDEATAELMSRFYRALFKDRLAPAAALRRAQVAMWREQPFRDPYFWGAFVLQGDWRNGSPSDRAFP